VHAAQVPPDLDADRLVRRTSPCRPRA
jgi:hypothetical protein